MSDRTYMETLARSICEKAGDIWNEEDHSLYLSYAVLARVKGVETTSSDVHDAWAAWSVTAYRFVHRSATVPFEDLSPEVQAFDDVYRDAIRAVAGVVVR